MQLLSADATIFLKKDHENKKKTPSKIACFTTQFVFSVLIANWLKSAEISYSVL